jgi:hypothetical protein
VLPQAQLPVCVIVPVRPVVVDAEEVISPCLACTFNLFVVTVAIFVDSAVYALIVLPALGLLILVMLEFWCDAELLILLSSVVHCVAVTVVPALTLETVPDCP